jgi:hypothetical protein
MFRPRPAELHAYFAKVAQMFLSECTPFVNNVAEDIYSMIPCFKAQEAYFRASCLSAFAELSEQRAAFFVFARPFTRHAEAIVPDILDQ